MAIAGSLTLNSAEPQAIYEPLTDGLAREMRVRNRSDSANLVYLRPLGWMDHRCQIPLAPGDAWPLVARTRAGVPRVYAWVAAGGSATIDWGPVEQI